VIGQRRDVGEALQLKEKFFFGGGRRKKRLGKETEFFPSSGSAIFRPMLLSALRLVPYQQRRLADLDVDDQSRAQLQDWFWLFGEGQKERRK
jgi:hypothetical protein